MYQIIHKEQLNAQTFLMDIQAFDIAKHARAGQFIILRIDEYGERIPLTINDIDEENGTVRIIFQAIGKTTKALSLKEEKEYVLDFVGPLGHPSRFEQYHSICIVVGGLGSAIGYLTAKQLYAENKQVDIVAGFKNQDMVILEAGLRKNSDHLYLCSDDGSVGYHGLVTNQLDEILQEKKYDLILTIGPLVMMKFVSKVAQKYDIPFMANMNPIMVDGSGMCGGCRLKVNGEMKFACVDGPDFEGYDIDFDELIKRNTFYKQKEQASYEHYCQLIKGVRHE